MKMKKLYLIGALLMAVCPALTSCDDENENNGGEAVETLTGIYTINNGNSGKKVPGSITAYDYTTGTATAALQDAFEARNGVSLGDIPQSAIIYGNKMYIAVYNSNLIWVVNPGTLEIITSIRPEGEAANPRYFTAKDGKVYASMYTGYVAKIDTASLKIEKNLKVGPNPEQLAIAGDYLFSANSDGMNYKGGYADCSVSVIDLKTFTQTKEIKDQSIIYNPAKMGSNGKEVFVQCNGNYADIPSQVKKIDANGNVQLVCAGTDLAVNGNKLYVINSPYGLSADEFGYKVYDTVSLAELGDMIKDNRPQYPSGIGVDSATGNIVLLSYTLSDAGYAQYAEPCYANIYSEDGVFQKSFSCGVGATYLVFRH